MVTILIVITMSTLFYRDSLFLPLRFQRFIEAAQAFFKRTKRDVDIRDLQSFDEFWRLLKKERKKYVCMCRVIEPLQYHIYLHSAETNQTRLLLPLLTTTKVLLLSQWKILLQILATSHWPKLKQFFFSGQNKANLIDSDKFRLLFTTLVTVNEYRWYFYSVLFFYYISKIFHIKFWLSQ